MKNVDPIAMKISFSLIAIFFALLSQNTAASVPASHLHKSALSNLKAELKACGIPSSLDSCKQQSADGTSCDAVGNDWLNSLGTIPILKSNSRPQEFKKSQC